MEASPIMTGEDDTSPSKSCATPAWSLALGWAWPAGALAWVAGTVAAVSQPRLWAGEVYGFFCTLALLGAALAALCLRAAIRRGGGPRWLLGVGLGLWAAALAAGALGTVGLRSLQRQAQWLPLHWEGRDVGLRARIEGLPQPVAGGTRVRLRLLEVLAPGGPELKRVQVFWPVSAGQPLAGEVWRLTVRLKRPHGLANPHGFDAQLWLWEQGVGATGSVRAGRGVQPPQREQEAIWGVDAARQWARQRLEAQLAAPPGPQPGASQRALAVLAALVVGDQSVLSAADWAVLRATGVGHLVSVSGLHVTMWAWLMAALAGGLWRALPRLAPMGGARLLARVSAAQVAGWGGLALATGYAVFAGWGVPAQRTVLMLAVWTALRLRGGLWPPALVWLSALAVVLAWDPWAWGQAGFWLSFVAVGVLMSLPRPAGADGPRVPRHAHPRDGAHAWVAWGRQGCTGLVRWWPRWCAAVVGRLAGGAWQRVWGGLRAAAGVQWRLSGVLAPVMLVWFGQVSLVGLLANVLAIPAVTLGVTPLAMAGLLWPPLWTLAAAVVELGMRALEAMAAWPLAQLLRPLVPWGWGALAAAGAWVAVGRWPPGVRLAGALAVVPVLVWSPPRPLPGEFELVAADVGQGSAVWVRTASGSVLVDAGPRWGPGSDAGQRVLVPLLQAHGQRLDALVLTHVDADHVGGAAALRAAWPQARVWASFEPEALARVAGAAGGQVPQAAGLWRRCEAGAGWEKDGVRFRFLHPQPNLQLPPRETNNRSCVLRIEGRSAAALLLGDLDARQEAALVARLGAQALRADWLQAPHHGSRHSSSKALLEAVRPRWVVIQAGYRNRYGHPDEAVLARLAERGVPWRSTPACGAAWWRSAEPEAIRCWREQHPHPWQPPLGVGGLQPEAGTDVGMPDAGTAGPPEEAELWASGP